MGCNIVSARLHISVFFFFVAKKPSVVFAMTISLCLDLIDVDFLWRRKRTSSTTESRGQKNKNGLRKKFWQTFRHPRGQKHQNWFRCKRSEVWTNLSWWIILNKLAGVLSDKLSLKVLWKYSGPVLNKKISLKESNKLNNFLLACMPGSITWYNYMLNNLERRKTATCLLNQSSWNANFSLSIFVVFFTAVLPVMKQANLELHKRI